MKYHARITLTPEPQQYRLSQDSEQMSRTQISEFTYERFGIGEVRQLIEEAHRQPLDGFKEKLIVVRANMITLEAQQAALKILEEPPIKTAIQLVLPVGTTILPTVLSRVVMENGSESPKFTSVIFEAWLESSYKDRIEEIAKRTKAKDTNWMREIKQALWHYIEIAPALPADTLKTVDFVLTQLLERGASNKMLLEELALSLPLTSTHNQ